MMRVKSYLNNDNDLFVPSEFVYCNDEDTDSLLNMALYAVVSGKKRFVSQYKETEQRTGLCKNLTNRNN